jgi:hypothetical protein
MKTQANLTITGHVKIVDLKTQQVLVDRYNAVNAETMSIIIANMLQGNNSQYIYEMHFGNGGTVTSDTGTITYNAVEENLQSGLVADLYNPLYYKVVDVTDLINNDDETRNKVEISHAEGLPYTDLIITCTLEESQPEAAVSDTAAGELVFDEIGLKSRGISGANTGYLLTHIVFEPVEKDAGRVIQIIYTLRINL